MGGADITGKIHGLYYFDHWLQRYKWWHSIFWWGVQVLMVNSYQCYRRYHKTEGLEPMTHYDYQTKIACAWLDRSYFDKDKKRIPQSKSTSTLTNNNTNNTGNTERRCRISERSLHPLTKSLKHRLNPALTHWPATSCNQ